MSYLLDIFLTLSFVFKAGHPTPIDLNPGHSLRFILAVDACTLLGSHLSHWGHVLRSCLCLELFLGHIMPFLWPSSHPLATTVVSCTENIGLTVTGTTWINEVEGLEAVQDEQRPRGDCEWLGHMVMVDDLWDLQEIKDDEIINK